MARYALFIKFFLSLLFFIPLNSEANELPEWWKQAFEEAEREKYKLLTPGALKSLYDSPKDFLILDVRPMYESNQGALPRTVNFEFDLGDKLNLKPNKRKAFETLLGPDKEREIVIYCRSFR